MHLLIELSDKYINIIADIRIKENPKMGG